MSSLPKDFKLWDFCVNGGAGVPSSRNSEERTPLAHKPFVIGVAGGTASGKTTVCQKIVQSLENRRVVVISQDSFYRDLGDHELELCHKGIYNFDHPDAFDYPLIEETFRNLIMGKIVDIPHYDFKTHRRTQESTSICGADVIIFEGILIFFTKEVRDLMDMKIFVDTDADTRLIRRIRRDIAERGREIAGILKQYELFVKPSFDDYIMPTKKFADIVLPRGGDNQVAIDLLVQHVKHRLALVDETKSSLLSSVKSSDNLLTLSGRIRVSNGQQSFD